MKDRPRTIQIFLPDGNPRSVRIAEITSRTVHAVEVPRGSFEVAKGRDELRQVGLYFLFGEDESRAKPLVYIGESEDCYTRLLQHHQGKDFWSRAVAVTSKTLRFDKAQVRWLEWHAIREATRIGRFTTKNATAPSEPYITEPVQADLLDSFDTIRVLLGTLGFPLFEEVVQPKREREVFFCRGRGVEGKGLYTEDGLLVLAGSQAAKTVTPSSQGKYPERIRMRLLASGVLSDEDEAFVFQEDHTFDTPSGASDAILGRGSNGWTSWKDEQGRTLDEVKRRPLTADSLAE
ncbi:MAG: GIY-YIG nuclease family protein [Bacteroidota bacterium]